MLSVAILRRSTRIFCVAQSSSAMSVGVTDPNSEPVGPAFTSKRSSVFASLSAIACASSAVFASCRARCVSRLPSSVTRASVASSASFRGRRKLRAYPRATETTSPRRPTLSTSFRRITCIGSALPVPVVAPAAAPAALTIVGALGDVWQERHLACALHGLGDLHLVAPARAGDAPAADLPPLGDVPPQLVDVLVVDLRDLLLAEVTVAAPDRPCRAAGALALRCLLLLLSRH